MIYPLKPNKKYIKDYALLIMVMSKNNGEIPLLGGKVGYLDRVLITLSITVIHSLIEFSTYPQSYTHNYRQVSHKH